MVSRWHQVSAPHGTAALRYTHWLSDAPEAREGVPGEWWQEDGAVRGRGLPVRGEVTLAPFHSMDEGDLLLRAFAREGALALRVYDPEAPSRTTLTGIERFPEQDGWAIPASFVAAAVGEERTVQSVDGYERAVEATGSVVFEHAGHPVRLTVSAEDGGLSAVIADESVAQGTYRFRFLPLPAPDAHGALIVDFRDAYLPPCAFSDQYVCPFPPAENRLPFAVAAGEKNVIRR